MNLRSLLHTVKCKVYNFKFLNLCKETVSESIENLAEMINLLNV